MSSDPRQPWWASEATSEDEGLDPLTAHRLARRGPDHDQQAPDRDHPPDADHGRGAQDAARGAHDAGDDSGAESRDPGAEHDPEVCGVCPICVGLRALQDARPELATHLTEAARHLAAAARELVERPPGRSQEPSGGEAADGFHRIDLD